MSHLSAHDIQAVLTGEATAEAGRALLTHLSSGCEDCEALLDEHVDLDTLIRLVEAESAPPVAPGWDQHEPIPVSGRLDWPRRITNGVMIALAAGFTVFVGVTAVNELDEADLYGIKGVENQEVEVTLRVLTGVLSEEGFDLNGRLEAGQTVSPDTTLLFELDASRASARYLFALDGEGGITVLFPTQAAQIEDAGRHKLTSEGNYVALDLHDWAGPLTLVATASLTALDSGTILSAYRNESATDGISFDRLIVTVSP